MRRIASQYSIRRIREWQRSRSPGVSVAMASESTERYGTLADSSAADAAPSRAFLTWPVTRYSSLP